MISEQDLDEGRESSEADDEHELALARLEWAKEAHCLDIPDQARAVEWHVSACAEAKAAVPADGGAQE